MSKTTSQFLPRDFMYLYWILYTQVVTLHIFYSLYEPETSSAVFNIYILAIIGILSFFMTFHNMPSKTYGVIILLGSIIGVYHVIKFSFATYDHLDLFPIKVIMTFTLSLFIIMFSYRHHFHYKHLNQAI